MEDAALMHFFLLVYGNASFARQPFIFTFYMFNYSAAILLLIKVYCAISWLYYLYLFIVYSREEGEQVGNGLFQGQTQTQTFAVAFGYTWVAFLTQHPTFPFWTKQENNVDIHTGCVVLESTALNITVKPLMDQKTAQLCY